MNHTIIMNENKIIRIQSSTKIYQGENNCDNIDILIPEFYGDIDLSVSSILLNWIFHYDNTENVENNEVDEMGILRGNSKLLTLEKSTFRERYLVTKVPLSINFTKNVGKVEFWIEVKTDNQILLKTNTVSININEHVDITDYVPNESIDLLSDMLVQMRQLVNTCNQTLKKATEQADRATAAAETTITLLEEWEAEYGSKE